MRDEEEDLTRNKALGRSVKFFGITGESAAVLFAIATLCAMLSSLGVPTNVVIAIFVSVLLTAAYLVKDGTGELIARFRKPVKYTRGDWKYQSPRGLKKSRSKRK